VVLNEHKPHGAGCDRVLRGGHGPAPLCLRYTFVALCTLPLTWPVGRSVGGMCEADRPLPKEANGEELVRGRARMVTEDTTIGPGDWDDRDLDGEVFRRVHFVDLDLMELADPGPVFEECSFGNVRFNVSVHENAAFVACSFRSCSFFDASFTGCKLTGSTFAGCTFGLLKADGGDWSFTSLAGADLRGSTFDGVRLRE